MTDDERDLERLAAAVAQCTAEFNDALPARVAALRETLVRARADDPEGVPGLVDGLHRLAGSAGTFGRADMGERARQLETACAAAATPGLPAGGTDGPGLAAVLDEVAAFIDELDR